MIETEMSWKEDTLRVGSAPQGSMAASQGGGEAATHLDSRFHDQTH
jgi:hypothetical protein